jgi:hypothetical protein
VTNREVLTLGVNQLTRRENRECEAGRNQEMMASDALGREVRKAAMAAARLLVLVELTSGGIPTRSRVNVSYHISVVSSSALAGRGWLGSEVAGDLGQGGPACRSPHRSPFTQIGSVCVPRNTL